MGGPFFSLVEGIRYFGWRGIGMHVVYVYAIPAMIVMTIAHITAFFLEGGVRRFLRRVVAVLSCVILMSFLVLLVINPTLKGGLIAFCATFMLIRSRHLLRTEE